MYLIADERDVVRVRTNYRGESVHLYRTMTTPADARGLFCFPGVYEGFVHAILSYSDSREQRS